MAIRKAPVSFDDWYQNGETFHWQKHDVFYRVLGSMADDKPVMLMLHGFPTSGWDWCWITHALEPHFTLIVPDLLDYGMSKNKSGNAASIMDQAAMLDALVASLNIHGVHLFAHDVGDTVAQELLARQKDKTLNFHIATSLFLNGGMLPDLHRPRRAQTLLAGPLGWLFARLVKKEKMLAGFAQVFGAETQPEGESLEEFWPAILGVNGRGAMARRIRYMAERKANAERWVTALSDATIPLMLINGVDDPVSGGHAADGFEKRMPKAKVVRLQGIGHYPQVEAPDDVIKYVLQFHTISQSD